MSGAALLYKPDIKPVFHAAFPPSHFLKIYQISGISDQQDGDIKADIMAEDRRETIDRMQPMRIGDASPRLAPIRDLAIELAAKAAAFRSSLPPEIQKALAHLVRAMNCYYSNLIEGHDTHPVDIERALSDDFSDDPKQRDLQLEARAHIAVQAWIDAGGLAGRAHTAEGLTETHARFCENLPDNLLWIEMPGTGERVRVAPCANAMSRSAATWPSAPARCPAFLSISNGAMATSVEATPSFRSPQRIIALSGSTPSSTAMAVSRD